MGKAFGSPRMAPVLAVVLGLLALGASLADVPLAIARHQTGPGGPVVYTLVERARLVFLVEARPNDPERFRVGQPVRVALAESKR